MNGYVLDTQDVWWRKDHFNSFREVGRDKVLAWSEVEGTEPVEFDRELWFEPEFARPFLLRCNPGYRAVYTWTEEEDGFHHRVLPVLGWIYDLMVIRPLTTAPYLTAERPAILCPDGEVVDCDETWPTLDEYLTHRQIEIKERAELLRRLEEKQRLAAERRAEKQLGEKANVTVE